MKSLKKNTHTHTQTAELNNVHVWGEEGLGEMSVCRRWIFYWYIVSWDLPGSVHCTTLARPHLLCIQVNTLHLKAFNLSPADIWDSNVLGSQLQRPPCISTVEQRSWSPTTKVSSSLPPNPRYLPMHPYGAKLIPHLPCLVDPLMSPLVRRQKEEQST